MGGDEGEISKFNEAFLKMKRLDKIQDGINTLRLSPLQFNMEQRVYNYQLVLSLLTSLYMEVIGKLSPPEKEKAMELKKDIEENLNKKPPFQLRSHYDKKTTIFVEDAWRELEKKINDFEEFLRIMMDKHGLGTPSEEQEGGFD